MTIGQRLKALREASGLTQLGLAIALGITPTTVSRWERGVCCPTVAEWERVCRQLGTTLSELTKETP
jgi:transcriptional regulator with XRE-family HTH domain